MTKSEVHQKIKEIFNYRADFVSYANSYKIEIGEIDSVEMKQFNEYFTIISIGANSESYYGESTYSLVEIIFIPKN